MGFASSNCSTLTRTDTSTTMNSRWPVKSLGFEMSKADLNAILQKHGVPSPIGPVFKSRPGAGSYVRPTKLILPAAVFHSLVSVIRAEAQSALIGC